MKITVCDRNPALAAAWLSDDVGIDVAVGSILDVACAAVISPANSFGFMDGGVDYAYSEFFGWHVQKQLQEQLKTRPFGELLVGEALLVETNHKAIPFVISAPTMRVPNRVYDPADIFLACRAATAVALNAGLEHIAFPGMGTGCGAVPFDIAASAMQNGIMAAIQPQPAPASWRDAQEQHFRIGR